MNAVHSEYKMGLQNEFRRRFCLMQKFSHEDSYFNTFTTGNLETLQKPGIREALLKFHEDWYSANIMALTVSSNLGVDKLEELVKEYFSEVENKNVIVPDLSEPKPFTAENLGYFTRYVPI